MSRTFKFEGKTYSLPDGTSDQEALEFIDGQHPVAASSSAPPPAPGWMERIGDTVGIQNILRQVDQFGNSLSNLGNSKVPLGQRAGDVVANLPIIGGPLNESAHALARLTGTEAQMPGGSSTRDVLRAVPGGAMVQQPFEDISAGRGVEGLSGAAMLALGLAGRGNGARYNEPIQPVNEPLGPGLSKPPGAPTLPEIPAGLRTAADWMLPVPHRLQSVAAHGYELARSKSGAPAKTAETRMMNVTPFNSGISADSYRQMTSPPTSYAPEMRPDPAQYGQGAHPVAPPVEVGGGHVPDYEYPIKPVQYADTPAWTPAPTGSMGKGPQAGFGSKPISPTPINSKSLPEGVNPPKLQPSPAEMAERIAATKKAELEAAATKAVTSATKTTAQTSVKPPFPTTPIPAAESQIEKYLNTTRGIDQDALGLTPTPGTATSTEPGAVGPGTIRNAAPHLDAKRHLFATGQELELPGSIAGSRATDYIREHAQRVFGNSVSKLTLPQVQKMGEWLSTHKNLDGMPAEAPAEVVAGPTLEDTLQQSVDQARAERNGRLGVGGVQ